MANGYRVRLGTTPEFYAASAEKPAVAYARLAESQWVRTTEGKWEETGVIWRDGVFSGQQAYLVQGYEKGDLLLVLGNTQTVESAGKDGKVYENERLYVNHFSPDLSDRAVSVVMDRSRRPRERSAEPTQEADQHQAQEQAAAPAAAALTKHPSDAQAAVAREHVEASLHQRLEQLVESNRVTPETATKVMDAYQGAKHRDARDLHQVVATTAAGAMGRTEALWVSSVSEHLVTAEQPLSWQQAEQLIPPPAASPAPQAPGQLPVTTPTM